MNQTPFTPFARKGLPFQEQRYSKLTIISFDTNDWATNVGWGASGLYFDVEISTPPGQGIRLHDLQIDFRFGTAARDLRFYTISGPSEGQTDINDWTLQAQWNLAGTARGTPTALGDMNFEDPLILEDGVHGFLFLSNDDKVRYVRKSVPETGISASGDHIDVYFAWTAGGPVNSGFDWDVDDPFAGTAFSNYAPAMIAHYEVIPEPSHAALALGVIALGWMFLRRRRG